MKFPQQLPTFILVLILTVLINSHAIAAVKIADLVNKELPRYETMSEEEYFLEAEIYSEAPYGHEDLAYEVRLPRGWEKAKDVGIQEYELSNKLLGEVIRYYGPSRLGIRSHLSIKVLQLEYQVSAFNWFIQYVLINGYTLEGVAQHSFEQSEGLYVLVTGDLSYVVRSKAWATGNKIVLAQYHVPIEHWNEERQQQQLVMDSFKLTNPQPVAVEKMDTFHFLDIAEFKYPESWKLRAAPLRTVDEMDVRLLSFTQKNILDGQIDIMLVSTFKDTTFEEEIDKRKAEIRETPLILGELIEKREDFIFDEKIDFAYVDVWEANDPKSRLLDYEVWLTVMSDGEYYYFVKLLTPARDNKFFMWAKNMETFKLVAQSLRPQDASLLYQEDEQQP